MMDFTVKKLWKDADAIALFALVVVLVCLPDGAFGQVVDRLQHPLVAAIVAAGPLGRFGVRIAGVHAAGQVEKAKVSR